MKNDPGLIKANTNALSAAARVMGMELSAYEIYLDSVIVKNNMSEGSLNTLYNPQDVISGNSFAMQFIILGVVGIALYSLSIKIFKEKDLPL